MIKFGVISFPGTNCEDETIRAIKRAGMDAEMILWNDPAVLSGARLSEFDGYAIAGGFSFEDRGRSGVVAAQEPITEILKKEAAAGKVILGICNGAQILVETGLVPGFDHNEVAIALSWNEMKKDGEMIGTGFYNTWTYLKNTAKQGRSAFNDFDEILHIPFAHGEGRFVIAPEILKQMKKNDQILFKYCTNKGKIDANFPITPNGSTESIAAICNPGGNVMAIMPHPERDPRGNGQAVFYSVKKWIETKKKSPHPALGALPTRDDIRALKSFDLEMMVRLIIVDNAERTLETALKKKGYDIQLERYVYYGIKLQKGVNPDEALESIVKSGELANLNKESIYLKKGNAFFKYDPGKGLQEKAHELQAYLIAAEHQDFVGESKMAALNRHSQKSVISQIQSGILWNLKKGEGMLDQVIKSKVLYNPHSMFVIRP